MWSLVLTAMAAAQPAPVTGMRVAMFACEIGRSRTNVLAQAAELKNDDELECRIMLDGVPARRYATLAGELRIPLVRGGVRTVASGTFKKVADVPGRAELESLIVPHSTWVPAVQWRSATRPLLPLVLHVFGQEPSAAKRKRWRLLLTNRIELDHRPRR